MFIDLIKTETDTAVSKHDACDRYFPTMYEAISVIMQNVYGDLDTHNLAFKESRYVSIWSDALLEQAEARWIDTIFGISALMSISTQLSYSKNSGTLCAQHGVPLIKLAEAASINIATSIIKDSQVHLHSLRRLHLSKIEDSKRTDVEETKKSLLNNYLELVDRAGKVVARNSSSHIVEMVFAQFPFESFIRSKWLTKEVA